MTKVVTKRKVKVKADAKAKATKPATHGPMMSTLLAEHRHMSTILKLLEKQIDLIESGGAVNAHVVYETMYYMAQYPDRFHHPREDAIYQRAAQLSPKLADDVDTLQRDHDQLADHSKAALLTISDWRIGKTGKEPVVIAGRAYINDLFRHMEAEEKLVFPVIESTLSAADWRELELDDNLSPAADPVFGTRVDREFRNVARSARRAMRRGVENFVVSEWIGFETLWESIEVLSMARDDARASTQEYFRSTVEECRQIVKTEGLLSPLKCTACSLQGYGSWLRDQVLISRDMLEDIGSVKARVREDMKILWGGS